MGSHPINLALRSLLELCALLALGTWGWQKGAGWLTLVFGLGVPVGATALWGIFAVPDDPSRSGAARIAVPGSLRLVLEVAVFLSATWALFDAGHPGPAWALATVSAVHYLASYDRVLWLFKH